MRARPTLRAWRYLLIACVVWPVAPIPASAQADAVRELRQRVANLSASELRCEQAERATLKARFDAIGKPYRSSEERLQDWQRLDGELNSHRECLRRTDADLFNSLGSLELECQKRADTPGPHRDEALACVQSTRTQRIVREQLNAARTRQFSCEEQAQRARELIQTRTARLSAGEETKTSTQATDDIDLFRSQQAQFDQCAHAAQAEQVRLKARLTGAATPAVEISPETYRKEIVALLAQLQQTATLLANPAGVDYGSFANRVAHTTGEIERLRTRYAQYVRAEGGAGPGTTIIQAGAVLGASVETWRREHQEVRNADKRALASIRVAQWQEFRILVSQASAGGPRQ